METFENEAGQTVSEETFSNNVIRNLIGTAVPNNGNAQLTINVPNYLSKLYIRRKKGFISTSKVISITNNKVNYTHQEAKTNLNKSNNIKPLTTDYLYCVNGSGELFTVDPLNGNQTLLASMPMGSYTCAIDPTNNVLYSIGKSSPFPLMKYTISSNTWETITDLGIGGPRLGFNSNDGLLYFSKNAKVYTFDPSNGNQLNSWDILGLDSASGGDLDFADNGDLYICTFSGLYKLDLNGDGKYQSTRISADNLPFSPTSMSFDSNQELWLADNGSSSDLIIMDIITGGWEYKYGINADNGTDIGRTINDLTTLSIVDNDYVDSDTDGDTTLDNDDCAPNDPDISFKTYTPSKYGLGTVVFEDLWPSAGDYDFNDVALNYRAVLYTNSQNLAVKLDFICTAKSHRSGSINAIGFQFDNVLSSQIESVTNTKIFENYLSFNTNGTEAGQDKAVIIITDNAHKMPDDLIVTIEFTEPINTNLLGTAPFNTFIIGNQVRNNEIHLPYKISSNLGNQSAGNFIANTGYAWAISIIHDFKVPKETVPITSAYNNFNTWATSGGTQNEDWYTDSPGNRNNSNIEDD